MWRVASIPISASQIGRELDEDGAVGLARALIYAEGEGTVEVRPKPVSSGTNGV